MGLEGRDATTTDTAGLEVLSRDECLRLLARAPIGRIVFTDRALPAVQPVNFTMHGVDIIIRTSPDTKLARATRNTVVAFEVDDYDVRTCTGWSVMVVGLGREVVDPDELAVLETLPLRSWAPGPRAHFIRVVTDIITGRRIPS